MNPRLRELAEQAGFKLIDIRDQFDYNEDSPIKKFADLIVQECIKQAHSVGDLRGVNDDMTFGADTAALKISKHFGVEE